MEGSRISIVVPVYEAELTLYKCLKSIQRQDYKDIEVVVVLDGKNDYCEYVSKMFALNDNRFQYCVIEHGGAGKARNKGISLASGEYICFVDSDDTLEPSYISSITGSYDLTVSGYKQNDSCIYAEYNNSLSILDNFFYGNINGMIGAKLFRMSIIKDNNLLFDDTLKYGEDTVFVAQYCSLVSNIRLEHSCGYNYISTQGSLMNNFKYEYNDWLFGMDKMLKYLNVKPKSFLTYEVLACHDFVRRSRHMKRSDIKKIKRKYRKNIVCFLSDKMVGIKLKLLIVMSLITFKGYRHFVHKL